MGVKCLMSSIKRRIVW